MIGSGKWLLLEEAQDYTAAIISLNTSGRNQIRQHLYSFLLRVCMPPWLQCWNLTHKMMESEGAALEKRSGQSQAWGYHHLPQELQRAGLSLPCQGAETSEPERASFRAPVAKLSSL